jgi:hypothetical protein
MHAHVSPCRTTVSHITAWIPFCRFIRAFYKYFNFFNDERPLDKAIVTGQSFEEWAADHKDELLAQFDKQH